MTNSNSKLKSSQSLIGSKGGNATSMAELMQKSKSTVITFKKGDIVKGTITKLSSSEILVDIQAKTEAVVLERDKKILRTLLAHLKVGDSVDVQILQVESDMGHPMISLRRFIDAIVWKDLEKLQKETKQTEITIKEFTKGGYVVETQSGIQGFLPNSQLASGEQLPVGGKVHAYVLEIQKQNRKVLFATKPIVSKEEFETITKDIKVGQKMSATIASITPFGAFANLQINGKKSGIDGLIHISELSWDKVENIGQEVSVGQPIEVIVIGKDTNSKRLDLSLKRTTEDPFEKRIKGYEVDQKAKGTVVSVSATGVRLEIPSKEGQDMIEGFIKKEKIPVGTEYKEGDSVQVTIYEIDKRKHRLVVAPVLREKPLGYR